MTPKDFNELMYTDGVHFGGLVMLGHSVYLDLKNNPNQQEFSYKNALNKELIIPRNIAEEYAAYWKQVYGSFNEEILE